MVVTAGCGTSSTSSFRVKPRGWCCQPAGTWPWIKHRNEFMTPNVWRRDPAGNNGPLNEGAPFLFFFFFSLIVASGNHQGPCVLTWQALPPVVTLYCLLPAARPSPPRSGSLPRALLLGDTTHHQHSDPESTNAIVFLHVPGGVSRHNSPAPSAKGKRAMCDLSAKPCHFSGYITEPTPNVPSLMVDASPFNDLTAWAMGRRTPGAPPWLLELCWARLCPHFGFQRALWLARNPPSPYTTPRHAQKGTHRRLTR